MSLLTNNSAMTALQTLKSINKNLNDVQSQISTGKEVGSAKDNSAVWAISKVMESDVKGFKAISDSLALGESTVAVGRQAAETVTDLLTDIKGKIVASQEENVDRAKIQTDIEALTDQIKSVVGAAQFNGLNLLENTGAEGTGNVDVLSSLDRSGTGVSASNISVGKQDLGTGVSAVGTMATDSATAGTIGDGATGEVTTLAGTPEAGMSYQVDGAKFGLTADAGYVARDGDNLADISKELVTRLNFQAAADESEVSFSFDSASGAINVENKTGADITLVAGDASRSADGVTDGTVGGGLELLNQFDVSSDVGAEAALAAVEGLIDTAIDSAAQFGSAQGRIEMQNEFVGSLMDSLKSGIGSLVDADMEETSARLQALQVQQQLGTQSLSIANQAPQSILSLFR